MRTLVMDSLIEEKVCRLCAVDVGQSTSRTVYDASDRRHVQFREPLDRMIKRYCGISIVLSDGMSTLVCDECGGKIAAFDEFVVKCAQVQKYLESGRASHLRVVVKEEDDASVKSEPTSDHSDHVDDIDDVDDDDDDEDDSLPISQFVKKRTKSKKSSSVKIKKKKTIAKVKTDLMQMVKEEFDDTKYKKGKINSKNTFFNFDCYLCNEPCENWHTLNRHCLDAHDTQPKIKCTCDQFLFSRQSIRRHLVKHGGCDGFKCDVCDKSLPDRKALELHSYSHIPKEEYSHICSQCPKKFATIVGLKIHEKTHIPREVRSVHPCNICGLTFISKANVKIHANAVHDKSRPFVCDVCGHTFTSKGNLHEHRLLHTEVKLFGCSICPKQFKTKKQLYRHSDCHKDIKYKCSQCPAMLTSRRTLRIHMYIHEDKYRYICAICNKGYKRRKSLKCHLNIHTGERPYSCLWCSRTFADNSNCRIHKKRVHPNELAEYEALHGLNQVIKKDSSDEPKIIYNTMFKKRREDTVVVMPNLPEMTEEAKINKPYS